MHFDILRSFYFLAFVLIVEGEFAGGVSRRGNFDLSGQMGDPRSHVALRDVEVRDAGVVPGLKLRGTPNAAGDETRTPIPSILIGRFADVGLLLGMGLFPPFVRCGHASGSLDGRGKYDSKLVGSRLQGRFHTHAPFTKYVVR